MVLAKENFCREGKEIEFNFLFFSFIATLKWCLKGKQNEQRLNPFKGLTCKDVLDFSIGHPNEKHPNDILI